MYLGRGLQTSSTAFFLLVQRDIEIKRLIGASIDQVTTQTSHTLFDDEIYPRGSHTQNTLEVEVKRNSEKS